MITFSMCISKPKQASHPGRHARSCGTQPRERHAPALKLRTLYGKSRKNMRLIYGPSAYFERPSTPCSIGHAPHLIDGVAGSSVKKISRFVSIALFVCNPLFAFAQSADSICTDRPTKANATCTVPQGNWQLETDIGYTTRDRQNGVTTETSYYANPYLKYGLNDHQDLEISWAPSIRTRTKEAGQTHTNSGVGDVYLRFKSRLSVGDTVSMTLIPFVKAPTAAHGLGNDRWEGGVIAPMSVALPQGFSLTIGPEIDLLADMDGHGHHAALTNLVNASHALSNRLTLAIELWVQDNHDPAGTIHQRSADIALIFLVNPTLQLDVGANVGLNHSTPDSQVYLGLSHRF
ncbi:transporter [Dyella sp. 20L07]|uniref:transporter n=1 Tax=Dyella sp. 20L07 TaxID=3384240 RepID=UPI003D28CE89